MKKTLFVLLMVTLCRQQGYVQQDEANAKALQAMRKLVEGFQRSKLLSFDILYRYAAEDKPGEFLDSMRGQCKLHGNRYWSNLDNTESVYDAHLLLMLFKDDSIMYLAKPAVSPSPGAPGAMPDTFLLNNKSIQYSYQETPAEQLITLSFEATAPCKRVTWHISRKTGYPVKMTSLVRTDQLYDPSVRSLVDNAAASWVIVETMYSNYRQGEYDETVFNLGKYIKKEGQEYVTVAPYEGYKVCLGSTGL
jgi:hypothetical protein